MKLEMGIGMGGEMRFFGIVRYLKVMTFSSPAECFSSVIDGNSWSSLWGNNPQSNVQFVLSSM